MIEREALIFNIQKYNMYDGPGVRTMVFLKGCPLRCKWCSNPEDQYRQFQVLFKKSSCVNCGACVPVCPVGIHKMSPGKVHTVSQDIECIGCRKCEEVCTELALKIAGEQKTISELAEIVEEDKPFYDMSGGGITLSGGEALMQPEAAMNLLMVCRQKGINTAVETCGYVKLETLIKVAEFIDTFLYDIKHMDSEKHYELTGVRNELILSNAQWLLENRFNVKIRVPLLKGHNDSESHLNQLVQFLTPYQDYKNFKGIDLLPYHKMGVNKYSQLRWEYPMEGDPTITDADIERLEEYAKRISIPISIIRH